MPKPYPLSFGKGRWTWSARANPVAEVARLLGITELCLCRWKRQDLIHRGLKPGTGRAESADSPRRGVGSSAWRRRTRSSARQPPQWSRWCPKERYRLVAGLHADGGCVRYACYSMSMSPSSFYEWKTQARRRS